MSKSSASENKNKVSEKPVLVDDFVVEFRKYKTELTKKYMNRRKWEPDDPSKVLSFIPGTITKMYVREGDLVEPGMELMVLEAMKMKNTVFAEVKGVVKKINAEVGKQVPKGKVIFEFKISES